MEATRLDRVGLAALAERFAGEHERTYGHRGSPGQPVDLVNLRLVASGIDQRARSADAERARAVDSRKRTTRSSRQAYFGPAGLFETPVIDRADLGSRPRQGPLIVEEYDATAIVPPGCTARLDELNNIVIEIGA